MKDIEDFETCHDGIGGWHTSTKEVKHLGEETVSGKELLELKQ